MRQRILIATQCAHSSFSSSCITVRTCVHATGYCCAHFSAERLPMDRKHMDALNKALPILCRDMHPDITAVQLKAKGCFTQNMVDETAMLTMTKYMRNNKIVELLRTRGPTAFDKFIDILIDTEQVDLVVEIDRHLKDKGIEEKLKNLPSVPDSEQSTPMGSS